MKSNKIAIIGLSGLFPGSETLETFWDNLVQKRDLTSLSTTEDFGADTDHFYTQEKGVIDRCYSLRGGYVRGFKFNPEGYQLPADYLAQQDKLYQWSLHVAKDALEDSGYAQQPDALKRCGVILGNLSFPTTSSHRQLAGLYTHPVQAALRELLADDQLKVPDVQLPYQHNEILRSPSEMVVEGLGLGGSHYAIDAACATSLYAIKLACDALTTGQSDMMLAGAVCGSDQLFIHMGFSVFRAYAPYDAKFAPLDQASGGLVSSEGAGMVVLKRLEDAERDGDHIWGIVGGTGLSNDGHGKFLLSPNPKGQRLALERAYAWNGLSPQETSYLECHATGTPLGDVTEMNTIADFFEPHQTQPLLGSVKSNMGHLLTVAGMTGLFKVLLAMKKGLIPPNINLEEAVKANNGWINANHIIQENTPWTGDQAGINSFGFGGTNAHLVIQRYQTQTELTLPQPHQDLVSLSIIGMDAHFGRLDGLEAYRAAVYNGTQDFRPLPKKRWKGVDEYPELLETFGLPKGQAPQGAYLDSFEFDLLRYKIQPQEAKTLEPQQALILKVADRAIQDAQLKRGQNVAVLIAMEPELAVHHYLARWDGIWQFEQALSKWKEFLTEEQIISLKKSCSNAVYHHEGQQTPSQHTSFVGNIMASRIAALWDFSGPAFTVSCGIQSVFKTLEIAQTMLSLKEVDAVVVGGVDLYGGLENVVLRQRQEAHSLAKHFGLTLQEGQSGWLPGEGAGAVVLKRQTDVQTTKERAYAHIDSLQSNAAPTGYCELMASGFQAADQAELDQLLTNVPTTATAVGAASTIIGHTGAAAGIASLIKTALCLHHRFLPGVPNWTRPAEAEAFRNTPYYFPTESRPWLLNSKERRRATVLMGDLQQITLSAAPECLTTESPLTAGRIATLVLLKGDHEEALHQQIDQLQMALKAGQKLPILAAQAYQEQRGRYTIALVAKHTKGLLQDLRFMKAGLGHAFATSKTLKTPSGSYFSSQPLGKESKVAFVYPGSAAAYPGLGKDIFQLFPELHQHFEPQVADMADFVGAQYLYPQLQQIDDTPPNIYQDAITMMSAGVFSSAIYTHLFRHKIGLQPDQAFGYSMGESAGMLYALRYWKPSYTDYFRHSDVFTHKISGQLETLAEEWNITPEEAKQRWISWILFADRTQVTALVDQEPLCYLSFINTHQEVIISGDKDACHRVIQALGCVVMEVPFQNVIHHDFCRRVETSLIEMHNFPLKVQEGIALYSSITKGPLPMESGQIARNSMEVCCHPVNFPAITEQLYADGARIFIEMGANATCTNWISAILKDRPHLAVSTTLKGKSEAQRLLETIAALSSHGLDLTLDWLYPSIHQVPSKRAFNQSIVLGGPPIRSVITHSSNQALVATAVAKRVVTPVLQAALEPATFELLQHSSIQKTTPVETNLAPTSSSSKTTKAPKLGENGLPLHDFNDPQFLAQKNIVFSEEDLIEFANGSIGKVFGPEYNIIDRYRRRVMLPMDPYLLVSRVTELRGERGVYKPSFMQTEYDIPYDAWYLTDGQIPSAVAVESGQCDLLLISYLGIDFENKGDLVYRLLDCTLTFVDDLPYEGQSLRYDISINSFVRNADNLLFFFSYNCYVGDRLVLKMRNGCAGFFSDEQLDEGLGVVYTKDELAAKANAKKPAFTPLLTTTKTSFSKEDLRHLIEGRAERCFDDISYYANGRNPSLRIPPEKILMIDRVVSVDRLGGSYGLGLIVAEKDLSPEDWFFPCHFRDDEVLAGSLQAEGGGNLLRFFMLYLGLQRMMKDARFQPVFDLDQKVRCRKQVVPHKDTKLIYRLEVKEIGLIPNPYVIADLEIISNGLITVHFENLGLQIREKTNPRYLETEQGVHIAPRSEGALLNELDVTNFALGHLSDAFGPDFHVYDGRNSSRQPNGDLQVVSRVLSIDGERGNFKKPSTIEAEYDVPQNIWFYDQNNSTSTMPYSMLMEIALQPCGVLGAYMGSTLQFADKDLFFRNLDGNGELLAWAKGTDFRGKTIHNKAVLESSVALGGTIIQNYTFELSVDGQLFYKGSSSFGFFPPAALAQQVGLDNGKSIAPWYQQQGLAAKDYMQIKLDSLYGKMKLYKAPEGKPFYRLATEQLNLLNDLKIVKNGGEYGKGYIYGHQRIQPYDWFFTNHFYQDPVMPGSLGVEAILQAMQVYALQQGLGKDFQSPKFAQVPNHKTEWKYRGQILRSVDHMHCEVHFKSMEQRDNQLVLLADAYLWNEETRIYHITDLALGIEEA